MSLVISYLLVACWSCFCRVNSCGDMTLFYFFVSQQAVLATSWSYNLRYFVGGTSGLLASYSRKHSLTSESLKMLKLNKMCYEVLLPV